MGSSDSARLRPDSTWWRRRTGDSDVVVAGSPLRFFRIGARGHGAIDIIERGGWPEAADELVARLIGAGAVHPLPVGLGALSEVTVVIPARDEDHANLRCLVEAFGDCASVVIVDDGSRIPLPELSGSRNIRRDTSGGPAAARNAGLAAVATRHVLFCDADVSVDRDAVGSMLPALLGHLADPRVVAAAPRVESTPGSSMLARYEVASSPLDMGGEPALVRAGTRVSYVPSACVLFDAERLRAAGGFDEGLRYGEDVDVIWRLSESGAWVRYEPTVRVSHRPRDSWSAWWRQRVGYGSAAADLDARHPGSVAPLRLNRWSLATWGAPAVLPLPFGGLVGVAAAVGSTIRLAQKLGGGAEGRAIAIRLAGRGNLFAIRSIAAAITRVWWPVAAMAALVSRRWRRIVVMAIVIRLTDDRREAGRDLDPMSRAAIRLADDLAYGCGVWKGSLSKRRLGALRPVIE